MDAYVFLIVATSIWVAFGLVLATRPVVLDQTWGRVRGLPLVAKPFVWIAFLPWRSGLDEQLADAPRSPDPRCADRGRLDPVLGIGSRRVRSGKSVMNTTATHPAPASRLPPSRLFALAALGEHCAAIGSRLPVCSPTPALHPQTAGFVRAASHRAHSISPANRANSRLFEVCVTSGDGGNRTRVRDRVAVTSTSVSGALFSSRTRHAGGVARDQLPEVSPVWRERTSPGEPASDSGDPRGRQAGARTSLA